MVLGRLVILFALMGKLVGTYKDLLYRMVLFGLLLGFLRLRLPYMFGMFGFVPYLLVFILPVFLGLMLSRVLLKPGEFFSGFVPSGTPLLIAPFVCLAETIRYVVRPVVLMIRPFLNITIGCFGGHALGLLLLGSYIVFPALVVLFFYEIFVALVH